MLEISRLLQQQHLHAEIDAKGRARIETESGLKLVKRIYPENLREQAFVMKREIPGLYLHRRVQLFSWQEKLYQIIELDPDLACVEDPRDALEIVQLYACSDYIAMLTPKLDINALVETQHTHYHTVKRDGHPRAQEVSLGRLVEFFHQAAQHLWPSDENRFRSGFVHEDLQTGNLLAGRGLLHIIDLDPILHTYSIMNLTHFFVMEVIARQRVAIFDSVRRRLLAALGEESERDFDFFILLAVYRVLVRRAYHKDYFADSLFSDFAWYFRHFALEFYLGRVRSGR